MRYPRWKQWGLWALPALLVLSSGCGGGGGNAFLVPFPGNVNPGGPPVVTNPGGNAITRSTVNSIQGKVTLGVGASTPTLSLFESTTPAGGTPAAPRLVATQSPDSSGAYTFNNLSDGSYTLVISGSGLRPQSDNFLVHNGQGFFANYTVTALAQTPSDQELNGFAVQAAHLTRAFYGMHASANLTNFLVSFNQRVTPRVQARSFTSTSIAVAGAQQVAVDPHGDVWVSTASGTTGQVAVLSNTGTLVGQFSTSGNPNGGARAVAANGRGDVAVANSNETIGVFPGGNINASPVSIPIAGQSVVAMAGQNGAVTIGGTTFTGPHFVATTFDNNTEVPELFFLDSAGHIASSGAVAGLNNASTVFGVAVNPADNTIFLAANVVPGGAQSSLDAEAHVLHLSADGSTVLEDINLVSAGLFDAGDELDAIALDGNGTIFVGGFPTNGNGLVRISGTAGSRTFSSAALTTQHVAVDGSGNVWAIDASSASVTQFDNNLQNPSSVTLASNAQSIALDANGNAFLVSRSSGAVTRLAAGAAVSPGSGSTSTVLPDGSHLTTSTAGGVTTVTQTFQNGASNLFTFGNNEVTQSGTTVTLHGSTAFGPTASSVTATVDATTGQITYTSVAENSFDGVQVNTTTVYNPDGSETVTGATSSGATFTATYTAPLANGTTTMTATFDNSVTGDHMTITAQFEADGSLLDFTISDPSRGMNAKGDLSTLASWNTTITDAGNTQIAQATDSDLQDVLVQFLTGQNTNPLDDFQVVQVPTAAGTDFLTTGVVTTPTGGSAITTDGTTFNDGGTAGSGDSGSLDGGDGTGGNTAFDGAGAGTAGRIIK